MKRWPSQFCGVWCLLICLLAPGPAHAMPPKSVPHAHATYAAAPRTPEGRVDGDLLLARLQELGVGAYYWLVALPNDWEDLQLFAPKARAAGIEIWPYLLPPSESPPFTGNFSEPYQLDYIAWGEAIARAATENDNIPGWIIDDFYANHGLYTPEYMATVQRRMKAIRPALKFYPLMYFNEIDAAFAAAYRPVIDGVVIAYPQDREDIADARAVLRGMASKIRNQMRLQNATPTQAGDYVAISQVVSVVHGGPKTVSFREFDDFYGATEGYHFKQLLVDDTVVWEADVAGLPRTWKAQQVDLSPWTTNKNLVELSFRLYDKQGVSNFGVRWRVSDLQYLGMSVGFGFNDPERWRVRVNGPFETGFGRVVRAEEPKFTLPLVVMTAGQTLEFRLRHDDPASPERIAQWLRFCLDAEREGLCDGVVTYALDLDPASETFRRAKALFEAP